MHGYNEALQCVFYCVSTAIDVFKQRTFECIIYVKRLQIDRETATET